MTPPPTGDDPRALRRRARAFERELAGAVRAASRGSGLGFCDGYLWRREGEFFLRCSVAPSRIDRGAELIARGKTVECDDLVWQILHMDGDGPIRASAHATSAFVGPEVLIGGEKHLEAEDPASSREALASLADACASYADGAFRRFLAETGGSAARYYELLLDESRTRLEPKSAEGARVDGLGVCIALIGLGRVEEAREFAARKASLGPTRDIFAYGAEGKGDSALIVEYCDRLLAGQKGR